MIKLSILIPTTYDRLVITNRLVNTLLMQIGVNKVEVLTMYDNREKTTGQKRNELIESAKGKYVVFFDSDDEPAPMYINSILKAIESDPDVIPINGYMSTNGSGANFWDMGLGFGYGIKQRDGMQVYDRFPNHIAPMKKELIKDFKFKHVTIGEDYEWAKRINDAGVLKTEYRITENIYHYKFIENK